MHLLPHIRFYMPYRPSWQPTSYTARQSVSQPTQTMTQITSHILDTSLGKPANGVLITLLQQQGEDWYMMGSANTDTDGRVGDFTGPADKLPGGIYKLTFYLSEYYERQQQTSFYPYVEVAFEIAGDGQHYHVPLLLNPFGFSTYRGS